jgi:hypothetical protein
VRSRGQLTECQLAQGSQAMFSVVDRLELVQVQPYQLIAIGKSGWVELSFK